MFSRCSRQETVAFLPFLRERRLQPGETLCRAGQPAADIWLILQGTLCFKLEDGSSREMSNGLVGEEAALGIDRFLSDIVAKEHTTVVALAKDMIPARLKDQDSRALAFCQSIIQVYTPGNFSFKKNDAEAAMLTAAVAIHKSMGWIAAALLPLALLQFIDTAGLRWEQQQLAAALLCSALLWGFRLVPPYVAVLFVVLVCGTLGIVPTAVVLSGFASDGFFLAMSVFSLGAVLIDSGVIARLFLLTLKHCPRSKCCYDFLCLFSGLVLTSVVPSVQDRVRVLAPLATKSAQNLGYPPGSRATTRLVLSTFFGVTFFSPMLLTGGTLNLALYGSLSEQVQQGFPWLHWIAAALAAAIFVLAAYIVTFVVFLRSQELPLGEKQAIEAQLDALGPMQSIEWIAIFGVMLFFAAECTVSIHKIDHRLIALSVICGYLVLGVLGKIQLKLGIEWSSLLFLGTLIGVIATLLRVDLPIVIAQQLVFLSELMKYHQPVFIVLLGATVWIASLLIPLGGALVALYAI
ncbi:MAG: SLC13 family permease, partial [Methylococcales bacterium]